MPDLNALALPALFNELTRDGSLHRLLLLARDEDLGPGGQPGDITSRATVSETAVLKANLVMRAPGTLAGILTIPEVLKIFAPRAKAQLLIPDGDRVSANDIAATIEGPARELLAAERTLLNLVGRLSGIATRTRQFADAVAGLPVQILDTRKTTPGLRNLEKYAVRCGGGFSYRIGLYDAVLIKDNHIAGVPLDRLPDFVRRAALEARSIAPSTLRFVELEVDSLEQFEAVLNAGLCPGSDPNASPNATIDIILLDNMPPARLRQAVALRARHASRVYLEASGGVTLDTIRAIAESGVDRISIGGLTHHAVSLDVALDAAGEPRA